MAIQWDPVLARALAAELRDALVGARLRAFLLDRAARNAFLFFRESTLVARLHPQRGEVVLHPATEPLPGSRSLAARVRSVEAPPDDRLLRFQLLRVRGRAPALDLVLELMTNQWNAVLVEVPEARIRHVLVERERGGRALAPGARYLPPPASAREGLAAPITRQRWLELLEPLPPRERRPALLRHVAWTSSVNASALLDGGLDPGHELWLRLREGGDPEPVLLKVGGALQPYPRPLPGPTVTPVASLLAAFRRVEAEAPRPEGAALLPSGLLEALEAAEGRARRRTLRLESELRDAPDPAGMRRVGDLLLARFGDVPRGADRVVLDDFEGRSVEIVLDPALPPQDNAARYYDRAARAERARTRLPRLLEEARQHRATLGRLLERARRGEAGAEEVEAALPQGPPEEGGARRAPRSPPYVRFRTTGGLEVRVGRGARQNDDLTFHHAAPGDVWLHARHAGGAHVILRWSGEGAPPARDLEEAAVLAAIHSRARTSGTVPVDWTRRKHVRKPRGAAPGAVVPDRVRTVFVAPDAGLAERLREG